MFQQASRVSQSPRNLSDEHVMSQHVVTLLKLIPLDYVSGVDEETNQRLRNTSESLKAAAVDVTVNIYENHLISVCSRL